MYALITDSLPERLFEGLAHDRRRIELEVTRMHDSTGRRVDYQRRAFRNRMADRREPHLKRTDRDSLRPWSHNLHDVAV